MKISALPYWLQVRQFFRSEMSGDSKNIEEDIRQSVACHPEDANLISSDNSSGRHILILDLDQEHYYTKSTTEGHGHLYINAELSYDDLKEIIEVLAKHKIVQLGIENGLLRRKRLQFRPKWINKHSTIDNMSMEDYKKNKEKAKNDKQNS